MSALERILRRDRLVIEVALAALTLVSWAQMVSSSDGDRLMPCCGARFGVAFWMWVVMMAGMMTPSVAPMVLTHAAVVRRRVALGGPYVSSGLFLGGYLAAWSGFSLAAAGAEWWLHRTHLLDPRTLRVGPLLAALVLLLAGGFQFSPWKLQCLSRCRAPLGYFATEWREGRRGALFMGLRHGWFCIGCCWLLMAILFAAGVMSLWWGAAITAFVMAEKLLPWRRLVVWSGAIFCFGGAALLLARALTREGTWS